MDFTVRKKLGKCRRGVLKLENRQIQTPGCSLYTRGGAVPHLTRNVLHTVADLPAIVHLTLESTVDQPGAETIMKCSCNGITEFLGLEEYVSYLSIKDPFQDIRERYNEEKCVSVWTPGGRKKVDVNLFLTFLQTFKPNIAECLCDTIPASKQTDKRIRKSVDRTLKFLDKCIEEMESKSLSSCNLFGVIEGSNSEKERIRSASETSKRSVAGFVLEGFSSSECEWNHLLQRTVEALPDNKPRLIHGLGSPEEVVIAVDCGIDLFDSSYPCQVAERGCALNLNWSRKRFKAELSYSPPAQESLEQKRKIQDDNLKNSSNGTDNDNGTLYTINLNETGFSSDFNPVVSGCTCYCCTNHTRAYIHHLLVTKEMLATVLLMVHNLQQYFQFFAKIRLSIEEDNFEEFKGNVLTGHPL